MTVTADELADELTRTHLAWFKKNPMGQLEQACLIFPEAGEPHVHPCGWANPVERQLTLAVLRALMIATQAVRYAMWSEVWMVAQNLPEGMDPATAAKDFAESDYQHGDFSRDPARVECVFTLVVEASGKTVNRVQRIIRGRSGGVRTLIPEPGYEGFGGALADLLPERTFN